MREGMVLYDAAGREIWACPNVDSRAAERGRRARRRAAPRDGSSRRRRLGLDHLAGALPGGSAKHEPEVFGAIAHVGHAQRLGALPADRRFVTDPSCGSSSNLFDLRRGPGRRRSLEIVGLAAASCPTVLEPGTVVGPVTAAAAAETGLAAGTPVVVGGADTQLGLVGIGVVRPDRLTSSAAASGS